MAGVLISNLEYFAQAESKPNKRPNSVAQIKCGTLGDFGCCTPLHPYPSHPLLSAFYAHFLYSIQTFVGPAVRAAVRAAVRVLLWHLPRVAFIIWLAQKALLSPCTATPTAARNELCIDFLFAILTALTLFLLQPAGAVERHEEGEEKVEQSERPHFDRDKRNKCAIGR